MYITELIGYKDHPINKARSLIAPDADAHLYDRTKLNPQSKQQKFIAELQKYGFKILGERGQFGIVLEHPNYKYVFKIFSDDPQYMKWLGVVKMFNYLPCVPKFFGKFINLGNNTFACRVEKLEPLNFSALSPEDQILFRWLSITGGDLRDEDELAQELIQHIQMKQEETYELIMYLNEHFMGKLDFYNNANFMMRGNQLVITDPVYSPESQSRK